MSDIESTNSEPTVISINPSSSISQKRRNTSDKDNEEIYSENSVLVETEVTENGTKRIVYKRKCLFCTKVYTVQKGDKNTSNLTKHLKLKHFSLLNISDHKKQKLESGR